MTEDEMVEWHRRVDGCKFDQTLGDSEGQTSPACCSPWGPREQNMTQRLHNNSSNEVHMPGGLKQKKMYFSHSSGGQKSEIKVSTGSCFL